MRPEELAVAGAVVFTPEVFTDGRGSFVSPMQQPAFRQAAGLPAFPAAQVSYSTSRRGVVRGVHFTATPPGCAKYVYVPHGQALDIVVDLRTGSPTFGRWDSVVLDAAQPRAVYLPVGVGHAFVARADHTIMSYLMSAAYDPRNELAVQAFDPALGLPLPVDVIPTVSNRDSVAPTLAQAQAAGLLPDYATCQALWPDIALSSP
ncbi:dTDP-4-dehydrorhamnose 3,5-epimerase [Actinophytocola sp.]|uniref:dTDP-4-dehydrorhamnose 3,5-epimerase family protein n=1 Tax=Actinophytocola sp. TaxID=1872138 RepID=UPI002D7EBDBE|nr:dTDP-4-dehydrorhamnose 3,5-epimerase [Actinophytocola sp.]HET9144258.1 dTDP-4-dehydrorhamnose 3,5-epimerase [Actinophytocola sp.]HEU5109411.1 dTDP-4-dehydrorhamnose 3,5-epimerase [Micromonosporaceae bacterium]